MTLQHCELTIIVRNDEHLCHAQRSSRAIQDDVANAPAHGALSQVVHVGLRRIFDQGDEQLDVGAEIEEIDPEDDFAEGHEQADGEEAADQGNKDLAGARYRLVAPLEVFQENSVVRNIFRK